MVDSREPTPKITEHASPKPSPEASHVDASRINVNTADASTLTQLPRIGPKLAERIIKARAEAPFTSADDLRARVRGIGVKTAENLAPLISF